MRSEELLVCLQLAVVSLAGVASSCSGDLINCDPGLNPNDKCLCFQVVNTVTGMTGPYRTCTSLTSLTYSSFDVREIEPGSFQHLDHLLSLDLSNNAPPELILHPRSFVGLTNLTLLNLQGDGLKGLPDCLFTPMTSLETLHLQGNNLTEINSQAFRNLSSLKTLYLDNNKLTELPPDLLENLPALTTISLSSNMWNCSSDNVRTLVELVHSGLVVDGEELMCANSTLVADIVIEGPTTSPFTSTPTPHSTVIPTSATLHLTLTLTPTVIPTSTTLHPTLTPTPLPQFCSAVDNSGTVYGFLDWPKTATGDSRAQECPHGPEGGVARRKCGKGGEWEEVEGSECNLASATTDALITITETDLSPLNIERVSSSLSLALSSPSDPLTLDEVEVVLDITEQLLNFNGASIMVLNNSLQAVDYLLSYSGDSVAEGGADIANRLRVLIDTALLSSLSTNNSNLVLLFSHLALGGIYINETDHTHILAVISMEANGATEVAIEEGGGSEEREGGSVEVEVDGELEGPVQVTVYNNTGLFNTSSCGSEVGIQGGIDLAPVISVSDKPSTNQETITITYHGVKVNEGDEVLCVKWNNSLNCGHGGWQTGGCQLRETTGSDLICVCEDNGTFALLDMHGSSVQSDSGNSGVVEYVFYACCVVAATLYLPVIMAVLLNRSLRVLPLKQCVANIAGSQSLSLLVMAASYHPHSPQQLCYSLGVLQHYTLLVALSWLAVYPIMAVLKVFRRMWFEHYWLLAPVAIVCWILPGVVVGAIGIPRYEGFTDDPHLCWLEADIFPTYFTFLSGVAMVLTLLLTILAVTILCCSDYDLEPPVHSRIVSNQLNAILYTGTIICHYITANSASHSHKYHLNTTYLLLITAIHAVLNASYFLLANGWANSHIRSVLLCREDPALKRKVASYQERTQTLSSVSSSRSSEHRNLRRNGTRINDEMNLNYVSSYLGYDEAPTSHVPLDMLGHVDQRRQGRRVKDRRSGELTGPIGPSGFQHVGFKVPHVTSMT